MFRAFFGGFCLRDTDPQFTNFQYYFVFVVPPGTAEPRHVPGPAGVSLPADQHQLLPTASRLPQPPRHLRLCLLPSSLSQVLSEN